MDTKEPFKYGGGCRGVNQSMWSLLSDPFNSCPDTQPPKRQRSKLLNLDQSVLSKYYFFPSLLLPPPLDSSLLTARDLCSLISPSDHTIPSSHNPPPDPLPPKNLQLASTYSPL